MTSTNTALESFTENQTALACRNGLPNMNSSLIREVIEHFGGEDEFLNAYMNIDEFGVSDNSGIYTEPAQVSWFFGDNKNSLLQELALICQKSAKNPKRDPIDCIFNGLKGEFSRAEIQEAINGNFDYESEQNQEHTLAQTKIARWVVYKVLAETCTNFKNHEKEACIA